MVPLETQVRKPCSVMRKKLTNGPEWLYWLWTASSAVMTANNDQKVAFEEGIRAKQMVDISVARILELGHWKNRANVRSLTVLAYVSLMTLS